MENLSKPYLDRLEAIATAIQGSELLAQYLETEEPELYKKLQEAIEPHMQTLYQIVADNHPMQLIALEDSFLEPRFEGLYLPRLLGFSVMRGVVNDRYKYIMPQEQFKKILVAICNSANFEMIYPRIGQTVQIGFALSSDIWISNLIEDFTNKKVRQFLMNQKLQKYRELKERKIGYQKYQRQFSKYNFYTTVFPETKSELHTYYPVLKQFMVKRILFDKDDSSLIPYFKKMLQNEKLRGDKDFVYIFGLLMNYFPLDDEGDELISEVLNHLRKEDPTFVGTYFEFLKELLNSDIPVTADCDHRLSRYIDRSIKDDFTKYYDLTDIVHSKGYIHPDTIEAIQKFYYQHEGLSTINECIRLTILTYVDQILSNLEPIDYNEYFELNKTLTQYIHIFSNQQFNQSVKERCLKYIRKLLKHYTDKRGKDYQDIKKFVKASFLDLGFMSEKELVELFKTKRKRRKSST